MRNSQKLFNTKEARTEDSYREIRTQWFTIIAKIITRKLDSILNTWTSLRTAGNSIDLGFNVKWQHNKVSSHLYLACPKYAENTT